MHIMKNEKDGATSDARMTKNQISNISRREVTRILIFSIDVGRACRLPYRHYLKPITEHISKAAVAAEAVEATDPHPDTRDGHLC